MGNKTRGIILGVLGKLQKSITFDKCGYNKTFYDGVRRGIKMSKKAIEIIPKTELQSQEWISVKDRLPTIYDADADNCVLAIHKVNNKRYYHWRSVADNPFDFTHWAKTPQPPKGD